FALAYQRLATSLCREEIAMPHCTFLLRQARHAGISDLLHVVTTNQHLPKNQLRFQDGRHNAAAPSPVESGSQHWRELQRFDEVHKILAKRSLLSRARRVAL